MDALDPGDGAALPDATATDALAAARYAPGSFATLRSGDLLQGRYRIRRFLASGGMGEVYEADDALLGDRVAVKLLRPELVREPSAQERFAAEIRLARRITHPNVCRVFDVGVDGPRIFFTMELHEGETLAGRLRRQGALPLDDTRGIVLQLLAGVGAAHEANVVHADLKPSNVLCTGPSRSRVVVTDFGLAVPCCTEIGCRCEKVHLAGTPAYAAPEQLLGGTVDVATDVFAIGVVLFELTTGQLPWRGKTLLETARLRLVGDTPSPRALRPELDARWDDTIRACLLRDPAARPHGVPKLIQGLGLN